MKLFFDHICGKQANTDFIHCLVSATFPETEYDWALDNGWCPSNIWYSQDTNFKKENKIIWYQSRQSRINLSKYKETKSEKRLRKKTLNAGVAYKITQNPDFDLLYKIYKDYINYKSFKDSMDKKSFLESYGESGDYFIIYGDEAFSVVNACGTNLISYQFCWDYKRPELCLGKYSTYIEIDFAKSKNLKNIYLGPSYEKHALYKSYFSGFEFWTGREWSENKKAFEILLKIDASTNTIQGITQKYDDYFSLLSV